MTAASPGARTTALVVNFNGGVLLAECVERLVRDPEVAAVLVVDNASTDGSTAAVEALIATGAPLTLLRNASNLGYSAAVNLGLDRVRTEFVLVVNPDCLIGPGTLPALLREADATPGAAICGCVVLSADGRLQNATRRRYPSPARALRRAVRWPERAGSPLATHDFDRCHDPLSHTAEEVDAVSGALMLVRMAAVADVGGLDEGYFLHCEDLDWSIRFRRAGWSVRFVPDGFAVHAKGASGGVRPWQIRWHMHRGMVRFYRKFEAPQRSAVVNASIVAAIWCRFVIGMLAHPVRIRLDPLPAYPAMVRSIQEVGERIERIGAPDTLLIGASSFVARYFLEHPREDGRWCVAVSRNESPVRVDEGVIRMRSDDGANLPGWARRGIRRVVHLAPLWSLLPYLENLRDVPLERVVACSSTSVVTRRDASGGYADEGTRQVAEAEEALRSHCESRGIELVILRPTLIYAPGRDRNVERIARLARRVGIFPLAGAGTGLRQPVHAEDVAHAVRAALVSPDAPGKCYTVSGGEVLTYRQMVERVFHATGRRPRIVSIPVWAYRVALASLAWFGGSANFDPNAAARMEDDHAFDHELAARELGFRPRAFLSGG